MPIPTNAVQLKCLECGNEVFYVWTLAGAFFVQCGHQHVSVWDWDLGKWTKGWGSSTLGGKER